MEPNKQTTGDAAPFLPTADELEEHLLPTNTDHEAFQAQLRRNAMQVGVVGYPSSQPQPHQHAVALPMLLNPPPQLLAPTASPAVWPPHGHLLPRLAPSYGDVDLSLAGHIFRGPAYDVSWWPQFHFQPQASSYVEFYPSIMANAPSSTFMANGSHFMNVPSAPTPSMAPRWSNPMAIVGVQQQQPPPPPMIPITSQNGSGSFDPGGYEAEMHHREPMNHNDLMSPKSLGRVLRLLATGDDWERRRVIYLARPIVHLIMRSRVGNVVFLSVLQAYKRKERPRELEDIIDAVCNGKGFLKLAVEDDLGHADLVMRAIDSLF